MWLHGGFRFYCGGIFCGALHYFSVGKDFGKAARWIGRLLLNGIIGGVVLYLSISLEG